mmetsp:Transcript_27519/g.60570  ORF Transcript_27519/g.60570 Transcript_27519/m.60570 type:complete len:232 (-) Transcript_27519:56-751(-)
MWGPGPGAAVSSRGCFCSRAPPPCTAEATSSAMRTRSPPHSLRSDDVRESHDSSSATLARSWLAMRSSSTARSAAGPSSSMRSRRLPQRRSRSSTRSPMPLFDSGWTAPASPDGVGALVLSLALPRRPGGPGWWADPEAAERAALPRAEGPTPSSSSTRPPREWSMAPQASRSLRTSLSAGWNVELRSPRLAAGPTRGGGPKEPLPAPRGSPRARFRASRRGPTSPRASRH